MKYLVIIATLVAGCYAAPASDLQHPSPINPSVLVEIKPEEKVVLITDPQEIAKFKRETHQPLYPTVLPEDQPHHIAKRDHKPGHETKPANKPNSPTPKKSPPHPPTTTKKPAQKPHHQPSKSESSNKRNRRDLEANQKPQTLPAYSHHGLESPQGLQKPQTLPAYSHHGLESPQELQKPQYLPASNHHGLESQQGLHKPQTLPILIESTETTHQIKRDIPVPLVPKYQHPEVSLKDSSEEKSDEDSKEDKKVKSDEKSNEAKKETNTHHAHHENHPNKHEVQVEDLSEHKPLHQTLSFNHDIPTDDATTDDENKPNISDDHLSTDDVKITPEHHLSRPKPVPVAELFARAHDN